MAHPHDSVWPISFSWLRSLFRRDLLGFWITLTAWSAGWAAFVARDNMMHSWGIFPFSAKLLLRDPAGGFHLYALRPDFQFGPVAALVAAPFAKLSVVSSAWTAGTLMTLVGLGLVAVLSGLSPSGMGLPARGPFLIGGLLIMPVWPMLSLGAGHLDDVLALGFGCFGILQVRRGNPIWAAVLLALAVDSKPWSVGFVVALLALPRSQWFRGLATWTVLVVIAWLPFFIVEPRTFDAVKYKLGISSASVLWIFGLSGHIPPWVRPTQLILALAIGALAAWAYAPQATLLGTVASRILIDPAAASYYTPGAILAAFFVDRMRPGRVPWFTLAVAVMVWPPSLFGEPHNWFPVARTLRLLWGVGTLIALVVVLVRERRAMAYVDGVGRHRSTERVPPPSSGGSSHRSSSRDRSPAIAQRTDSSPKAFSASSATLL